MYETLRHATVIMKSPFALILLRPRPLSSSNSRLTLYHPHGLSALYITYTKMDRPMDRLLRLDVAIRFRVATVRDAPVLGSAVLTER